MDHRAIHEIKCDATKLVEQKIMGAIEVADGRVLHRLADQLKEIADRFEYHARKVRAIETAKFAMGNYSHREGAY